MERHARLLKRGLEEYSRTAEGRLGHRALFTRVPRLCHELAIARADGTYTTVLARLARADVLVLARLARADERA